MFEGFTRQDLPVSAGSIHLRTLGSGPPLLLLHGYPQTHAMWHAVAPALAERFTVIAADLRGYGDSMKPPSDPDHLTYAKRTSAADMVAVMQALGFERFMVAGHDRGGRVAHRMALDHPDRVQRLAVLDIVPTRTLLAATNQEIATGYYHWFFLIQPGGLPERLIGGDPVYYLRSKIDGWSHQGIDAFDPAALDDYERCFKDPDVIHASCEDYRAGASIDLVHDAADIERKIACPLLVLWGRHGLMARHFDLLATWRERAGGDVSGKALDCGHFLPEEQPQATAEALLAFFGG